MKLHQHKAKLNKRSIQYKRKLGRLYLLSVTSLWCFKFMKKLDVLILKQNGVIQVYIPVHFTPSAWIHAHIPFEVHVSVIILNGLCIWCVFSLLPCTELQVVSGKLIIAPAEKNHSGAYVCVASNTVGVRESRAARLSVLGEREHPYDYLVLLYSTSQCPQSKRQSGAT